MDSVVIRVTGPVALPHQLGTHPEDMDWRGVLFILKPGTKRVFCALDEDRYSKEELGQTILRMGWTGWAARLVDLLPDEVFDWETRQVLLPNVEVAFESVEDLMADLIPIMGVSRDHSHAFSTPHALKYDDLREDYHWTSLGPKGLLGHFQSPEEAKQAIEEDKGSPVVLGEEIKTSWGRWWPVLESS